MYIPMLQYGLLFLRFARNGHSLMYINTLHSLHRYPNIQIINTHLVQWGCNLHCTHCTKTLLIHKLLNDWCNECNVFSEGYICYDENLLNLSAKPYKGFTNTCYTFIFSLPHVSSRAKRRIWTHPLSSSKNYIPTTCLSMRMTQMKEWRWVDVILRNWGILQFSSFIFFTWILFSFHNMKILLSDIFFY